LNADFPDFSVAPTKDQPLHVLILDDSADDVELILHHLKRTNLPFTYEWSDSCAAFACRLSEAVDIVLADYSLPDCNGLMALDILRQRYPDTPFILLSGAIGEELAAEAIKRGAADYLLKDRLGRLQSAIANALKRSQSEVALRESALLLQGTIDALGDHIAVLDTCGRIVMVNRAWSEFYLANSPDGSAPCGMYGNYLEVCHKAAELGDQDAAHFESGIQAVAAGTQESFEREYECDSPHEHRWYLGRVTRFGAGSGLRIVVTHQEITSRKRAQIELLQSEQRFRALIEYGTDVVSIADVDGTIRYQSPTGERLSGFATEDRRGRSLIDKVVPDDVPQAIAAWHSALDNPGQVVSTELRLLSHTGSLTAEVRLRNLLSTPGVNGIVVNTRDITERKRAEEALRYAEQRYGEHLKHVNMVAIMLDLQGNVLFCNEFTSRLTGWPAEELAGKNWFELFLPDDLRDASRRRYALAIETETIDDQYRGDIRVRDGSLRTIGWTSTWLRNAAGEISGVACLGEDITERLQTQAMLHRRLDQMRALHAIDLAIVSSSDLHLALDYLTDQIRSLLEVDAVSILLVDSASHSLRLGSCKGFREPANMQRLHPLGIGYAGRVAYERQLIHVPDARSAGTTFHREFLVTEEEFVGYIATPLIALGETVGVLEVFKRSPLTPDGEWLEFMEMLAGQTAIAVDNATLFENLQQSNRQLSRAYDATIEGWSRALDLRDNETQGHSQRVTEMSLELARALGLPEEQLMQVRRGALLHDIGKMGIPDKILLKRGALTDDERQAMQRHPEYAYEMLYPIEFLRPALAIPLHHHEWWDGTGYPFELKGEQIPLQARIFAVVDVWDALRSDRPYRKAWPVEKVREHIKAGAGSQFDPAIVAKFLEIWGG
jgi:PAS domain S-box-containing protein/putative nucleotidyltransferase with HDIG domain